MEKLKLQRSQAQQYLNDMQLSAKVTEAHEHFLYAWGKNYQKFAGIVAHNNAHNKPDKVFSEQIKKYQKEYETLRKEHIQEYSLKDANNLPIDLAKGEDIPRKLIWQKKEMELENRFKKVFELDEKHQEKHLVYLEEEVEIDIHLIDNSVVPVSKLTPEAYKGILFMIKDATGKDQ